MQDSTEDFQNSYLVQQQLRLGLKLTFLLKPVSELIVLGDQTSSVAVYKFGVVGKKIRKANVALHQVFIPITLLKY